MKKPSNYHIILEDRDWDVRIDNDSQNLPKIIHRNGNSLIVKSGNQHFHALIMAEDHNSKRYQISINGRLFTLKLETPLDAMINDMGLNRSTKKLTNTLFAPMPGMVLEIQVNEGESVDNGRSLLILEAMKMENVLKASDAAIIKKVHVAKGQAVEKGQALIEFE